MKKILFVVATVVCMVACSNHQPVQASYENDSIDSIEVVDSVITDSVFTDSI